MRTPLVLFCLAGLFSAGAATACDIENKRDIQIGASDQLQQKMSE